LIIGKSQTKINIIDFLIYDDIKSIKESAKNCRFFFILWDRQGVINLTPVTTPQFYFKIQDK